MDAPESVREPLPVLFKPTVPPRFAEMLAIVPVATAIVGPSSVMLPPVAWASVTVPSSKERPLAFTATSTLTV